MTLFGKSITGIDVGTKTVKIANCIKQGSSYKVLKAHKIDLPEDLNLDSNLDYIIETIRRSCEVSKIPLNNVALVASESWYQSFSVTLPDMPKKELKNALLFEIKRYSGLNISDVTFDYYLNNSLKDKNEYLVYFAEKERIKVIIDKFKSHKINIKYIDVRDLIALALYVEIYADDKQIKCFFDLGYSDFKVIFTKENRFMFSRTISHGVKSIYEILRNTVTEENLLELFMFKGLENELIEKILRDYFYEIFNELLRTIKFFAATYRLGEPSNIIYTGGIFAIPGVHRYFCQNIPYPCILNNVLDILNYHDKELRDIGFMFNYAVGAAIR